MGKWIRTDEDRARMDEEHRQKVRDALQDEYENPRGHDPATLGGDPLRLRGIPAIGRNVRGCILGTDPEREATR